MSASKAKPRTSQAAKRGSSIALAKLKVGKSKARRRSNAAKYVAKLSGAKPGGTATKVASRRHLEARRAKVLGDMMRFKRTIGDVVTVNIGQARERMPKMVRHSANGVTFLIANARRDDDSGALLMSPETFLHALEDRGSERTLNDVLSTLPFSGVELPGISARKLPGAGRPKARLPE